MAIRPKTQHASCHTCTRHKLILKQVKDNRFAHQAQTTEYGKHLKKQYADRVTYWQTRTQSRLGSSLSSGCQVVTVILDGMDKGKYKFPRSLNMTSKEFSTLNRPSLDAHGIIAHGHMAALVLSDHFVAKDSSWCCDLLAWTLNVIGEYTDLRNVHLNIQCDNTSRECKNGTILRFLALCVGSARLQSAQLNCLISGHSHEDIDVWFATIAHVLEARNELHTPEAFRAALDHHLQGPTVRQTEPLKFAKLVNTVRDWTFSVISVNFCILTSGCCTICGYFL